MPCRLSPSDGKCFFVASLPLVFSNATYMDMQAERVGRGEGGGWGRSRDGGSKRTYFKEKHEREMHHAKRADGREGEEDRFTRGKHPGQRAEGERKEQREDGSK
mmetsp:Transcript_38296/g.75225  ORF Transcript_38296/g.75225 Transcript_38296/m.75225 type:complete len:104 (+) Transcript_38296:604-915(+)